MNLDLAMQALRIALISLGPTIAATGYLTGEQWTTIVGGIIWLVPVAHSFYVKWGTKTVPAAVAARPDVPTVSPVTGATQ